MNVDAGMLAIAIVIAVAAWLILRRATFDGGKLFTRLDNLTTALYLLVDGLNKNDRSIDAKLDDIRSTLAQMACTRPNGKGPTQEIDAP